MVNLMLFPDCPKCGSNKVGPIYPDQFGLGRTGRALRSAGTGPLAPVVAAIGAAIGAASLAASVYERIPGSGKKQCKNCFHTF